MTREDDIDEKPTSFRARVGFRSRHPEDALERELQHLRVLDSDASAIERFCAGMLPVLQRRAAVGLRFRDPDAAASAATDVLMDYFGPNLAAYDPTRGSLVGWLTARTVNRARTIDRSNRRLRSREQPYGLDLARMVGPVPDDEAAALEAWRLEHRRTVLAFARSAAERAFVGAHLDDEPTEVQAELLGVAHLPDAGQRRAIARAWKRFFRMCRRRSPAVPVAGDRQTSRFP